MLHVYNTQHRNWNENMHGTQAQGLDSSPVCTWKPVAASILLLSCRFRQLLILSLL